MKHFDYRTTIHRDICKYTYTVTVLLQPRSHFYNVGGHFALNPRGVPHIRYVFYMLFAADVPRGVYKLIKITLDTTRARLINQQRRRRNWYTCTYICIVYRILDCAYYNVSEALESWIITSNNQPWRILSWSLRRIYIIYYIDIYPHNTTQNSSQSHTSVRSTQPRCWNYGPS